jgi:peptidylprolyl isomerase
LATAVIATGLLLAACSSDADDAESVDDIPESAVDLDAKPDTTAILPTDRGEPPTGLETRDLVEGEGDQAAAGDVVSVHYVGVDWETGEQFDASWDRGQPFTFELGAGRVIAGWDQGVAGMRVGGRRVLTIPPDLAYGEQGAGDVIGPGATLVFVVDLLEVE